MEPSDGKMFQQMAAAQCTEFTQEEALETVLEAVMPHHYNGHRVSKEDVRLKLEGIRETVGHLQNASHSLQDCGENADVIEGMIGYWNMQIRILENIF